MRGGLIICTLTHADSAFVTNLSNPTYTFSVLDDTCYGLAFAHTGYLVRPSFFEAVAARLASPA